MIVSAILAGGSGSRMGSSLPKQFLELNGQPVLMQTIGCFTAVKEVEHHIIAVGEDYIDYTRKLIRTHFPYFMNMEVIAGGSSRSKTLLRVLEHLEDRGIGENDIIITHDAARPLTEDFVISQNIEAAKKYGACNTCVPAVDTVFLSQNGQFMDSVPPRSTVFHAQTPQSFKTAELLELCRRTPPEVLENFTDACSVYIYHNKPVFMVRGNINNIKITYPADLRRAETIIKEE